MTQFTRRFMAPLAIISATALTPMAASAAGFQISEQSATGLGRSFAGSAAVAEDASTVFFNPAGMSELDKAEFVMGASIIRLGADFDKEYAVDAIGQPLSGGEGGSVGKLGAAPILYYVSPINDKWTWGLGINAPFGLSTDYEPDSIFRYEAIYSNVSTVNINPSVSYEINDNFSIGFGLNLQHMRVKLSKTVDYGAVCFGQVGPVTCSALGLYPQGADGYAQVEGDSNALGWNIGFLWNIGDSTNIGLSYRSQIDHDLEGDARFESVPAVFQAQGVFLDTPITAELTTPEALILSLAHNFNEKWMLTAGIRRTGWSTFQELRVQFENPNQPDTVVPENWEDVMRYAVGLDYKYNNQWTFRAGLALDESPVQDEFRTPRLPDADRNWVSFGATWSMSDSTEITASYAHLFLGEDIALVSPESPDTTPFSDIEGTYKADADIIAFQLRHVF